MCYIGSSWYAWVCLIKSLKLHMKFVKTNCEGLPLSSNLGTLLARIWSPEQSQRVSVPVGVGMCYDSGMAGDQ